MPQRFGNAQESTWLDSQDLAFVAGTSFSNVYTSFKKSDAAMIDATKLVPKSASEGFLLYATSAAGLLDNRKSEKKNVVFF